MHSRLARLLIAFALALVVPLQGLAAASGELCMGIGHHHSHDAGEGADHQQGHGDGQSSAHCAPCVACCAAAAISASSAMPRADDRAAPQIHSSPPLLAGIQPATLDRPPLAL